MINNKEIKFDFFNEVSMIMCERKRKIVTIVSTLSSFYCAVWNDINQSLLPI